MDKIVNAIREQLILSYTQAGRVVPTTVGVVATALQDALQFSTVEEVHNAFRRARDMADIPTQRVLKEALTNHRQETTPPPARETLIEDNYIGHKIPTSEQRAYLWATHSICGTIPKIKNDREIIEKFEADPKNKEYVEYQRGWMRGLLAQRMAK